MTVGELFNYCAHRWQGFIEGALQVVLFKVLCFKSLVKKHLERFYKKSERDFYMKMIVTVILTNLVTNLLLSVLVLS